MARLTIIDEKGNIIEVDTETGEARKQTPDPSSIWLDIPPTSSQMRDELFAKPGNAIFGSSNES